jgi:hypothetical protein
LVSKPFFAFAVRFSSKTLQFSGDFICLKVNADALVPEQEFIGQKSPCPFPGLLSGFGGLMSGKYRMKHFKRLLPPSMSKRA